ncbi:xanthine phosphoribosyltransferase [Azoarcus communis]|uniref:Xanthine phosphoribosyltransferase n=1 Tax=Parazoarcus communis SWub3 = DSM 12120 TaxID=1121029 RepID=A0A323UYH0_9RHOO|nr:xanthine phosphoribosyltransferase [Parazoarcus communis]NMG47256.1 xanthine phosphoribosyltransferase [Parazoarcus communis]NMG71759.1 xanthine phosphoribosyltransferase [Parazoarcus communis SWub3 = DSM 12120]PZA17271.1 xanthine phosphoribosyltransferase [Azoarcus communis] [Parazoarcus communis SWub3 = DSM 12120]
MTHNIELSAPFAPLVRRIEAEATIIGDQILKIDHFLNHRIEPSFIAEMGRELARRLSAYQPSMILTAEASGIAPGLVVAQALNVPLVFAKKYAPQVESPFISRVIPSPTKGGETKLVLSQRFIPAGSRVVIVDDFLSNGRTAVALVEMAREAGAEVLGAGFIVEKRFKLGHELIEALNVPVATLAQVLRLEDGKAILIQPTA